MKQSIPRYSPSVQEGLNQKQVENRIQDNLLNHDTSVPTKTIKQILLENFFTLFNVLNLILGILVFSVGSYRNMLFLGIVILNTAISTFQEIHSKRVVDQLSLTISSKSKVTRNGEKQEISIHDLVLDDIIELHTGNQVVTDSIIQEGEILVNESYITGEPDSISKTVGDTILSGSYLVSGKCYAKVDHIGEDNYTAKISSGAKYVKKIKSEIMTALKQIIKILTFIIIPVGLALFCSQFYLQGTAYEEAIVQSVAAVIGMIPEGLVLLTSTVLAVSVIRLSKAKVLVQDLYCIETLARVDTLCLDKTGTLTNGTMEVKKVIPVSISQKECETILANFAHASEDENATIQAIKEQFKTIKDPYEVEKIVPFSSQTKWSGFQTKNLGSYILGAPEFVLGDSIKNYQSDLEQYIQDYRVLVLAHSPKPFQGKELPNSIELVGYILLLDTIRNSAKQTLAYFKKQEVDVKIISGDNPITVSKIAKQVGVSSYDSYFDMSGLKDPDSLDEIVNQYTIFGRVSPIQKKDLIQALQKSGKTVAMTGDGVNDVLALKEADCSIAMANGSDATKNVSQLVLLNSDFASMPKVVEEGRRTINNIERSASLFLVKTIYSTLLAFLFLFASEEYPFVPIQLSLISVITIGIPSFMLALEPNKERIHGNFFKNIISRALPTGLTAALNIFALTFLSKNHLIQEDLLPTLCVISTGICGLLLLFTLTKSRKSEETKLPFSIYRLSLAILMSCLFVGGLTWFAGFFEIVALLPIIHGVIRIIIIAMINFTVLHWLFQKILKVNKEKI